MKAMPITRYLDLVSSEASMVDDKPLAAIFKTRPGLSPRGAPAGRSSSPDGTPSKSRASSETKRAVPWPVVRGTEQPLHITPEINDTPRASPAEEAYERGFADGKEAGRQEATGQMSETLAQEKAIARAEGEQSAQAEVANILAGLRQGFDDLERHLSETVARIIEPYVRQQKATQIVEALSDSLKSLLHEQSITISGPEHLLDMIQASVPPSSAFQFEVREGADVTIIAGSALIETQLGQWATFLSEQ